MSIATSVVKLNMSAINKLDKAGRIALEQTAEAIHTELVQSQKMPFRTGNLQNESTFVDYSTAASGYVDIISGTPYARRLYFHPEYNFSKDENQMAGGKWFDDFLKGGNKEKFAERAFAEFYRRNAGT